MTTPSENQHRLRLSSTHSLDSTIVVFAVSQQPSLDATCPQPLIIPAPSPLKTFRPQLLHKQLPSPALVPIPLAQLACPLRQPRAPTSTPYRQAWMPQPHPLFPPHPRPTLRWDKLWKYKPYRACLITAGEAWLVWTKSASSWPFGTRTMRSLISVEIVVANFLHRVSWIVITGVRCSYFFSGEGLIVGSEETCVFQPQR